ncbi:MAG: PIN domain-containing protein [archaeon]
MLLDTNIVINREANYIRNKDIATLFYWIDKLHYQKCIHPFTIKEIENHKDKEIVKTFQVKLNCYVILQTEAPQDPLVTKICSNIDKSTNDINDTKLINELVNNRVDFLITEDKKIHEKAKLLNIEARVFSIESFLEKIVAENPDLTEYKTLSVKRKYCGEINLSDSFFDSFRKDYIGFDTWFNKKANEFAYVCSDTNKILAFLYLKREDVDENYGDIQPVFSKKKRLKIGTFKVDLNGNRLGERFLKIVFDNALKQRVDEIYVTIFKKSAEHERLINLLEDWGFNYWGIKTTPSGEELVYVRNFSKSFDAENPKLTFPYISLHTNIFIVPIRPSYHTDLLPDSILNTESPEEFIDNEPHRNAISKVYISRSFEKNLKRGDIIVFYRTKEPEKSAIYSSVITSIGIVDNVILNIKNEDDFIMQCRKRSVFPDNELKKQWEYQKYNRPFIVNFLYSYSFPHRLNLHKLIELRIISDVLNAPRGFVKITISDFEKILRDTKTDMHLIVNL